MTNEQAEFNSFARELGERFKGSGVRWVVITWNPKGEHAPHSAGNLPTAAQVALLRSVADSLEHGAQQILRVDLGSDA